MKILLQNQYDDLLGGVETYFKLLIDALLEKGHEVIAVYTKSGKKKDIKKDGYKAFYLPNLDLAENIYFSGIRKKEIKRDLDLLESIVKNENPCMIHLNNTHYPRQYWFLNKYVPIIQTVHDFFNCCNTVLKMLPSGVCDYTLGMSCFRNKCISPNSVMELWRFKTKYSNREVMKGFQRLLVTTPYMKNMLIRNDFLEDKIQVVPLFVEDWGRNTTSKNDDNVVIYAGRLAKEKGVIHFIHMLKALTSNFKAFVIGDGLQREECENLVNIMGLNKRVEFTGFLDRNEIKDYFAKASVVVIPSLWPEPFCLVGLEAMSCSKPVVAYDVGGISSWLRDNYNGFLVPQGDIQGLARRADALLWNKKLANNMGMNGRCLYEEKFTKRIHVGNLISAYEYVITMKKRFFHAKFPFLVRQKNGVAGGSKEFKKYPKRAKDELLPEYNKRLIEFELKNNIAVVKSYPEELTISTTTRCNMDPPCVICERNLIDRDSGEDLDINILEIIKPILRYADRIYLHCGGEPLMTNKTFEIIDNVRPPTKIRFNTNGALFSEKTIRYMVDCNVVDVISFSLDAATERIYKRIRSADFNRIINNIKTLISYRNERNKGKPLLRPLVLLNFCIFKQNVADVSDYVILAHSLGVDGIDFSHLNQGFDWQQKREDYIFDYKKESLWSIEDATEHDTLVMKAYRLSKEYNIPINFNGNPFIAEINNEKMEVKNEIAEIIKRNEKCSAPWRSAVIDSTGRVRVCCYHYEIIGKLKSRNQESLCLFNADSFERLWNGKDIVNVRKEFIKNRIADRCVTKNPCLFQNRV